MAGNQFGSTRTLVFTLLLAAAYPAQITTAQNSALYSVVGGAITGRLTDLHSAPLDAATVVVRNEATGAEARTITTRNGNYRFTGLAAGEYSLVAQSHRLGTGRLEGIFVAAGHEAHVQTAMQLEALQWDPLKLRCMRQSRRRGNLQVRFR